MSKLDFVKLNELALNTPAPLLEHLLPGGKIQGCEYVCSDITGGPGKSMKVNLKTGRWADFATDDKGGDIIALIATQKGINQPEAARWLAERLGARVTGAYNAPKGIKNPAPAVIMPVPKGVEPPVSFNHLQHGTPGKIFVYRDVNGALYGYNRRFDLAAPGSGKAKTFSPLVYTEKGWRSQGFPELRPLYGLERIAGNSGYVLVVEGEGKADDAQQALGKRITVMSINGGSNAVHKNDFSALAGMHVRYWPDADQPGVKAALAVAEMINRVCVASFKIVVPPDGVPDGWDVGNAVNEGWSGDQLKTHIKKTSLHPDDFAAYAADYRDTRHNTPSAGPEPYDEGAYCETAPELPAYMPMPPEVPLGAFPTAIAKLLEEAAEAFVAPLVIPTTCFLAFLSCLISRAFMLEIKEGWMEPGNLWIMLIGASGSGKTPTWKEFFKPIFKLERLAHREFAAKLDKYNAAKSRSKYADFQALEMPHRKQLTVDDVTPEALARVLRFNPKGVMYSKDELAALIPEMGRYSGSGESAAKNKLLSLYDPTSLDVNRKNTDFDDYVPLTCLSIYGSIQAARVQKVFNSEDMVSGLLYRFLMINVEPAPVARWTDKTFSTESKAILEQLAQVFWGYDIQHDEDGEELTRIIAVSQDAQDHYVAWYNQIAVEAWLSTERGLFEKMKAVALRVCLLLHCLELTLAGKDIMAPVSGETMKRALKVTGWLKTHKEQCWLYFKPKNRVRGVAPLEASIMTVIVQKAALVEREAGALPQELKIGNAELFIAVRKQANMPGLPPERIGRAASDLGLTPCKIGNDRGRIIPIDKLHEFRRAFQTERAVRNG